MARRAWEALSPAYQRRLSRSGVTEEVYSSGASLKSARGHGMTPERPQRAFRNPDLYSTYLRRRVEQGKPVPPNILQPAVPRRVIGETIGYGNRDVLSIAIITRSAGGSVRGDDGVITILEADPKTGEWRVKQSTTYNQRDFVQVARDIKERGYTVKVESAPYMGVTA